MTHTLECLLLSDNITLINAGKDGGFVHEVYVTVGSDVRGDFQLKYDSLIIQQMDQRSEKASLLTSDPF
ncbi:hypothetical protein [Bacillus fonticola]|uniref:hypothetical protein n=1 Tax=Bacillus fonticola TaxID=2728853 RepID=UPI001D14B100|nr:hypothetical protein [Bacillus fonticola]